MTSSRWRALGRVLGVLALAGAGLCMVIAVIVTIAIHGPAARLALIPVFIVAGFALDYTAVWVLMAPARRRAKTAQAEGGDPGSSGPVTVQRP